MTQLERFEVFWQHYPRRVGKLAAQRSFERTKVTDELLGEMLTALAWQKEQDQWRRGYIPHPTTWLNQGRWLDEPDPRPLVPSPPVFSPRLLDQAREHYRKLGGCPHSPTHETYSACVTAIARAWQGQS